MCIIFLSSNKQQALSERRYKKYEARLYTKTAAKNTKTHLKKKKKEKRRKSRDALPFLFILLDSTFHQIGE